MAKKKKKKNDSTLNSAIGQIKKKYGEGSIMKLGADAKVDVDVIPTGAINLDAALGVGGIPRGRITEIYGEEASGKTTLALHIAAEAQKLDGVIAFIDAEHALDPIYARKLGINTDEMLISQPDTGEQALEIAETLVRSNAVDLIIVDSVAALVPQSEIDGEMGDSHVGLQARLMSQALRKLTGIISKSNCSLIFINQTRMKIGVTPYMNPRTTTGGVALKFYTSLRIYLKKGPSIKDSPSKDIIGTVIWVKIVKNKLAPPFKQAQFDIIYGEGISEESVLIEEGVERDIIDKKGSWYSYKDTQLGQGKQQSMEFLKENDKIRNEIEKKVKIELGLIKDDTAEKKNDEDNKDKEKKKKK
ncbi:MAG: recombinase RecA [Candidatus Cloacimonetes bacterium]|nr:recombinase RecA [Candidatus Cloacimonadota bacterium]MBS3767753.1 recombinase RecA [Candidatus Cloacimonadota bacterium]